MLNPFFRWDHIKISSFSMSSLHMRPTRAWGVYLTTSQVSRRGGREYHLVAWFFPVFRGYIGWTPKLVGEIYMIDTKSPFCWRNWGQLANLMPFLGVSPSCQWTLPPVGDLVRFPSLWWRQGAGRTTWSKPRKTMHITRLGWFPGNYTGETCYAIYIDVYWCLHMFVHVDWCLLVFTHVY